MIKYLQLRCEIYYHDLRKMLSSLANLFSFVMLILYITIPAIILMALISLSVIADIQTTIEQRIIYQWIYFILLYSILRVQKNAILGNKYQHYLASLPCSTKLKRTSNLLLTLIAGNLPLLTPTFLLFGISSVSIFLSQLHFPIFALSVWIIALISLKNNSFPFMSFLLAPFILFGWGHEFDISAISLNSTWLVLLMVEACFDPFSFRNKHVIALKYYWQIRWVAMIKKPTNMLSRIFICGLFISLVTYTQNEMQQIANSHIQMLCCWVLAILIGSLQFDNEKFYLDYSHYLSSLLISFKKRYCLDVLPAIFLAIIFSIIMNIWLGFHLEVLLLLPLGVFITAVSVSKYNKTFFILPSILYGLTMFVL